MDITTGKFDYFKVLFRVDAETFQDSYLGMHRRMCDHIGLDPANSAQTKVTALGGGRSGEPKFIIEVYGPMADRYVNLIPTSWLNNLRRCDVRWSLTDFTKQQVEDIQLAYAMATKKKRPNFFNTEPRQKKAEERDVGGTGLQWGSKKSRRHSVVYKRGKESLAYEFRVKDEAAERVGRDAYSIAQGTPGMVPYTALMSVMGVWDSEWEEEYFEGDVEKRMFLMAGVGAKLRAKAAEIAEFAETDEEADFWSNLSAEEQIEAQGATFEPSMKGWREAPQSSPPDISSRNLDNHNEDLPF